MHNKRLQILFAILLFFITPIDSRADTIVLKDGRVIHCDSAREDGKVVRYWIGEAALTVSLDRVERIEHDGEKGESLGNNSKTASPTTTGVATRLADLPPGPMLV